MAFIVEDGTGLTNATSYVSVSDAIAYFADSGNQAWVGKEGDPLLEQALVRATRYIDNEYRGRWLGVKASSAQALAWPRTQVIDGDGYTVTGLPVAVIAATCEAADVERATPGALSAPLDRGGAIKREKAGPVEVEYMDTAARRTVYSAINGLLCGLIVSGLKVMR